MVPAHTRNWNPALAGSAGTDEKLVLFVTFLLGSNTHPPQLQLAKNGLM